MTHTIKRFRLDEVLNPRVRQALAQNFELLLLFSQKFEGLDSDIDPTHNPDWCAKREQDEQALLEWAQDTLAYLRASLTPWR